MKWRDRLSIRPTWSFGGLVFVLGVIWYAASSQSNAGAYLLLFALSSVFLVSIPHTAANLRGLSAKAGSIQPAFAGQEISLPLMIVNESRRARHGIAISLTKKNDVIHRIDNVPAGRAERVSLRFPASTRGEHTIDRLWLNSVYPFGFARSRKKITTSQRYVVYPKPAGDPVLPREFKSATGANRSEVGEGDDFAGVRAYVPGESQRHIDWKAVARGQALMTKQFTSDAGPEIYVDLAAARQSNLEDRLSQLALWIIEAQRAARPYGLRLPGLEIRPALGHAHFHSCLHALALFK